MGKEGEKGFTTKEFLATVVVMALLCLSAVPPFYAMRSAHRRSEMEKTATLLAGRLAETGSKPAALDANPSPSPCLDCFTGLLDEGVSDPLWYKVSSTTYLFSVNGNSGDMSAYQEKGDFRLEYDAEAGSVKTVEFR